MLSTDLRHQIAASLDRLAAAVGSASELSRRAGLSRSHVGLVIARLRASDQADIEVGTLARIAEAGGSSVLAVLGLGHRVGDAPGYAETEAAARARCPQVPDEAWRAAAETHLPKPAQLTPTTLAALALLLVDVGSA